MERCKEVNFAFIDSLVRDVDFSVQSPEEVGQIGGGRSV